MLYIQVNRKGRKTSHVSSHFGKVPFYVHLVYKWLLVFFLYNFVYLIYAICKQASIFCQWSAVSHSVEHQIGKKVASSSLTQVTVLCHLSKTLFPLLSTGSNQEDRKHPDMTEQEMSQTRDECPQRNWSSIRHI